VTVAEYLDAIKECLLASPVVSNFHVIRERDTLTDGHLRARLSLADGGQIEFSEYVQRSAEGQINVVTYSYHWADAHGDLIRRWDNTPHFPDLAGFPHHVHDGHTGGVSPGPPVSIFVVLEEVTRLLA
jgi:hypothetical protein